ncbi:PH domain-containing protein [Sphingomonas sp. NSE70-1]|uniref:PH domain-containing protein n=1 Tax=Sphingomonas caseinilyticus TaxID=2908205 RepID=A0ABT0RTV9_9SPHN|nr:PH domain-containing protein [Sphingomonas caseinilyticus]MCL6698450.1 PH domain-containing protein [Sphingomonas caseinilyticus]
MTAFAIPADIQPVEPGYRNALRARAAVFWVPVFIASLILDRVLLAETLFSGLVPTLIGAIALSGIIIAPERIYRRLGYALDDRLLRTVRGWLFHTDTIVPFVRVQHIDVTRGPFDKMFGTATLVVHTAGTHNSVVTLPGLSPERAAEIREAIRHEIRADAE